MKIYQRNYEDLLFYYSWPGIQTICRNCLRAVFEKRRDSLIALYKWEAKREFLRKADLPVLAAGDRPVTREAQECLDHVILPDQLCGTARNVIDLTDQQLDGFECVRRRRTSNHRGSQTDGSNSSHSNSPRRRPQTDGSSNPLPAPRACTPLAMPPLVYRRRRNVKPIVDRKSVV